MSLCWYNRWHPTKPRCKNDATMQSKYLNNAMDKSQWCDEHSHEGDTRLTRPVSETRRKERGLE